jgi:hypothetical protein
MHVFFWWQVRLLRVGLLGASNVGKTLLARTYAGVPGVPPAEPSEDCYERILHLDERRIIVHLLDVPHAVRPPTAGPVYGCSHK